MVSDETKKQLERLLAIQNAYKPNDAVLALAATKTVVCFVGASSVGKTTLMDALSSQPGYGKTHNFTSRPPRPEDDPSRYYYFDHTDKGLGEIFDRISSRELLQYNINPYNLFVYGSAIEGYTYSVNLCDIFSSSIDGFRNLGFGKLYVFSTVTDPKSWLRRFNARFSADHTQRTARLQEAVASLTWSLAQTNPDHRWVINPEGNIAIAAQSVIDCINGTCNSAEQTEAKRLAAACLKAVQEQLVQSLLTEEQYHD